MVRQKRIHAHLKTCQNSGCQHWSHWLTMSMTARNLMLQDHADFDRYTDQPGYVVTHPPYIPQGHGYWEQMAAQYRADHPEEEWTPFEKKIFWAFQDQPKEYTSECLDPEDLIALIEQGNRCSEYEKVLSHISKCGYCQDAYSEMEWTLWQAAEARELQRLQKLESANK